MTYREAVEGINSALRFGIKPGLERVRWLLEAFGNPQEKLQFVHVAGTNGKGSTAAYTASILQQAGFRTGLYTSPYVCDFCERIRLDGKPIPRRSLAAVAEQVLAESRRLEEQRGEKVTEFELITVIALVWYAKCRCDAVVLEVGLGGRLDATNIIPAPRVAVLTPVSLDHMAVLGNTVEKIAAEKCGILKPGTGKVIVSPGQQAEGLKVMRHSAEEHGLEICLPATENICLTASALDGQRFTYKGVAYETAMAGAHQPENAAAAIEAALAFDPRVTLEHCQKGIAEASLAARLQVFSHDPLILVDGGHNIAAVQNLVAHLTAHLAGREITLVTSMMGDKDVCGSLSLLSGVATRIFCTRCGNARAMSAHQLAELAGKLGFGEVEEAEVPKRALLAALNRTPKDGAVVICGSFYLAGELLNFLTRRK